MLFLIVIPFVLQALIIGIDEFWFHVRRGLPKWERIGHPLDTLTVLICLGFTLLFPFSGFFLKVYVALALFSCIFVTKDEFVHKECCPASEQWLHALLFLNHPVVLTAAGLLWPLINGTAPFLWMAPLLEFSTELRLFLISQTVLIALFLIYQILYWNLYCSWVEKLNPVAKGQKMPPKFNFSNRPQEIMEKRRSINNAFYDEIGEGWYEDAAHPIALLRAENAIRNPWIISKLKSSSKVLDIGCGAGLLSNALSLAGHDVTGVDLSGKSLEIARRRDQSGKVNYLEKDAFSLDFEFESFDAICAMDFLEHVENPEQIVRNAAKYLKPGGLFFFHTFNRNIISHIVVIKGVEWLVPNTPKDMHVYRLFIKPKELANWCKAEGFEIEEMHGLNPVIFSGAFWKSLMTRKVSENFSFQFTSSLKTGYLGFARKGD